MPQVSTNDCLLCGHLSPWNKIIRTNGLQPCLKHAGSKSDPCLQPSVTRGCCLISVCVRGWGGGPHLKRSLKLYDMSSLVLDSGSSSESLWTCQNAESQAHPRLTESESPGMRPQSLSFHKLPGDFWESFCLFVNVFEVHFKIRILYKIQWLSQGLKSKGFPKSLHASLLKQLGETHSSEKKCFDHRWCPRAPLINPMTVLWADCHVDI